MNGSPLPQFEMIGPTVEDDVRRLIGRYGKEAVQAATRKLTTRPRGRQPEGDWKLLAPYLSQDSADWLEGRERASN
jgi:hypothetical protein